MAEIVYGFGSSHGPLLSTPPEKWDLRAQADKENPAHPYREGTYTWPELRDLRKDEKLDDQIKLDIREGRHARNQKHMDALAEKFAEVNPDILVVVGDDQQDVGPRAGRKLAPSLLGLERRPHGDGCYK